MTDRNWPLVIAALRRKAEDPSVTPAERALLTAKADELAVSHHVVESRRIDPEPVQTTVRTGPVHATQYSSPKTGSYTVVTWLADLDENPAGNGWMDTPWIETMFPEEW